MGDGARPYFVDTDISLGTPGAEIDDGAALILLLRAAPEALLGLSTVFGNVPVELATRNSGRLLALLGHDSIPIFAGAARPLTAGTSWLQAWYGRYGHTPPWPVKVQEQDAAGALIEAVRRRPGEVTILALGPLTNLAQALARDPAIEELVGRVVLMGGSLAGREPEFNFRCDPEAAGKVLAARWPLTLFGLDITRRVLFSRADFGGLPDDDPAAALLKRQAIPWIDAVEEMGWEQGGCALHDAVAALSLLDESLFEFAHAEVGVELDEEAVGGALRPRPMAENGGGIRVASGVDAARCYAEIMQYLRIG